MLKKQAGCLSGQGPSRSEVNIPLNTKRTDQLNFAYQKQTTHLENRSIDQEPQASVNFQQLLYFSSVD